MKLVAGWVVSAGLVFAATSAGAQVLAPYHTGGSPYRVVSDFEEPYGGLPPVPPPYPPPPYAPPPYASAAPAVPYRYEPGLMPPREVYAVLRDNGFMPLGIPRRQGLLYEISVIDPNGEDGRLVIDGRNGRIIRFLPASYWGGRSETDRPRRPYAAQAALPPPPAVRGVARPPALNSHVATRPVPLPAPKPASVAATKPAEAAQSVRKATETAPLQAQANAALPPVTTATGSEVKAPPQIKPTQDMPPVQGLD